MLVVAFQRISHGYSITRCNVSVERIGLAPPRSPSTTGTVVKAGVFAGTTGGNGSGVMHLFGKAREDLQRMAAMRLLSWFRRPKDDHAKLSQDRLLSKMWLGSEHVPIELNLLLACKLIKLYYVATWLQKIAPGDVQTLEVSGSHPIKIGCLSDRAALASATRVFVSPCCSLTSV